jgi:UDP-N-acetylglucosamine:LPS N-acetylglucosamine transferase
MDLMAVKKKSILIPTPGQTEQEYLARYLMQQNLALCIPQNKFNLQSALSLASSFPYQTGAFSCDHGELYKAINNL